MNYHDPSPEVFARHIRAFKKVYSLVSLDTVAAALSSGAWSALPPKPMVITFDDGYAGNAALVQVLEEEGVPAVIYTVAGVVGTRRRFWFSVVPDAGSSACERRYLSVPDVERRQRLMHDFGFADDREYQIGDGLSAEDIDRLRRAGAVIGSHSMSHPDLTRCDPETASNEINESKALLEALIGCEVSHFAYPGGAWNEDVVDAVRRAGYRTARIIGPGWVSERTNPYALPNFGLSDDAGPHKAIVQASGVWDGLKVVFPFRRRGELVRPCVA